MVDLLETVSGKDEQPLSNISINSSVAQQPLLGYQRLTFQNVQVSTFYRSVHVLSVLQTF